MNSRHLSKGLFLIKTKFEAWTFSENIKWPKYIPKLCFLFSEHMLQSEMGFKERHLCTTLFSSTALDEIKHKKIN